MLEKILAFLGQGSFCESVKLWAFFPEVCATYDIATEFQQFHKPFNLLDALCSLVFLPCNNCNNCVLS